jgi:hypothetical protein
LINFALPTREVYVKGPDLSSNADARDGKAVRAKKVEGMPELFWAVGVGRQSF